MKSIVSTGALALALALGGCGDGGSGGGNTSSGTADAGTAAAVPAPNGGDWSQTVTQTAEGGFLMGNPNAPVKIVEFASMTCPHCAEFSETGLPALTEKYINTGQASLEFRNFVRDPADLAASLLARCGGPTPFFKLSDQIFAAQEEWIGKLQAMSPAQMQALQSVPPQQAVATMAESAGLIDFVRVRGIPTEKARQCLGNQDELNKLVAMQQKITTDHPDFPGTPSFLINGELAQNTSSWAALEPKIAEALR
jgi:protein-disulfide isomerase